MANRVDPDGCDETDRNRQLVRESSTLLRSSHAVSQIWPCEVCRPSDFALASATMGSSRDHGERTRPVLSCRSSLRVRLERPGPGCQCIALTERSLAGLIADAIPPDSIAIPVPKLLPHEPAGRLLP